MDVRTIATTKLGPLPAWAWGGIAGGGALAFRLWRARSSNASTTDGGAGDPTATTDAADGTLGVARPDLLGGRDTAGWPPASDASTGITSDVPAPDWYGVPPDWYTSAPPAYYDTPGSTIVDQPAPIVAPGAPATATPATSAPADGGRQVGPWTTKAARDAAVANLPANRVRKFQIGGKFYADIYPAPAAATTPGLAPPTAGTGPAANPTSGGHGPVTAPAPQTRDVGPWATAAMRTKALGNAHVVRLYSNAHGYFATIAA